MHNTNMIKLNVDRFDCSKPRRMRLQKKIHALDENPDDEKSEEADASKMRDIVAAAGSTTKALAKALKEEEHLKAKLRRPKVKVTHWRAHTHTLSHTAALD